MASLFRRVSSASANLLVLFSKRTQYSRKLELENVKREISSAKNLMEFFEPEKNWGATEIRSGRSWKLEELRIKSNSDLHKLWFVLLKEHNMLLTMEQAAKDAVELFPSPERIDKVQESMRNVEEVVRERNRAYHALETGESGERKMTISFHGLGLKRNYKLREHVIPERMNRNWNETLRNSCSYKEAKDFVRLHREKQTKLQQRHVRIQTKHVLELLERFPETTREAVEKNYPDVDVDRIFKDRG